MSADFHRVDDARADVHQPSRIGVSIPEAESARVGPVPRHPAPSFVRSNLSSLQRNAGNRAAQAFARQTRSVGGAGAEQGADSESLALRELGEHVHQAGASSKEQVHRRVDRAPQKAKVELPVPLESVESIRVKLVARQNNLNSFLTTAKQDISNIRTHFSFVNGTYNRSHANHAMVVAQAKTQAESKQQWVDFAFGVGVGISVGLMSEALIAGKLAEAAFETLAEVGAEIVEGGIARLVKPEVPKPELIPGLAPELKQIRSLQILDDLNVVALQMAVPGTFVFTDPLVQCERLSGELRLLQAGADADRRKMNDAQMREQFANLTKFEAESSKAEAKLVATKASFDKLRVSFFARPAISDKLVEQDIWIPWIAAQDIETFFAPTLFNNLIRQHMQDIGLSDRLGAAGLPNRDRILGDYWPHNPGNAQERNVVKSYVALKNAAAAEAKLLPAFWNKVFLQ